MRRELRARIHRGAHEIGGNCVEMECEGVRILLDAGLPLDATGPCEPPRTDAGLLGVIVSHAHLDHYGLVPGLGDAPLYMGRAAARILDEAAFFTRAPRLPAPAGFLEHGRTFELGPFRVTPFLVDHSAHEPFALLVEAAGRRLLYSGDLRLRGPHAARMEELGSSAARGADVLILEGTHAGSRDRGPCEREVEDELAARFGPGDGIVLVYFSPQNVDRLVSVDRAARRAGRRLVIDLYAARVADATGDPALHELAHRTGVFLPDRHRQLIKRARAFDRERPYHPQRVYPERLPAQRDEIVLLCRGSIEDELGLTGCVDNGGRAIWSMWTGYLDRPSGAATRAWLDQHGVSLSVVHSSGHAFAADLVELARDLAPRRVVPIHTAEPETFERLFPVVERFDDGVWWEV